MDTLASKLYRMESTYICNIDEIEEELKKINMSVYDKTGECKSFLEVVDEICNKFSEDSKENDIKKEYICQVLVGLRYKSLLHCLINRF